MSHILIVGKAYRGVTKRLSEAGHEYTVLRDRATIKYPEKRYKRQVACTFTSRDEVIASIEKLPTKPDAILVIYENYVLAASWVASHLHLPGMPHDAAMACTDKWLMRTAFAKTPTQTNPDFAVITNEDDLRIFAHNHSFPLMLKPANLVKSLLITKSNNLDELIANYRHMIDMIDSVYERYSPDREPTVIIEEFLSGSMHTVAAFVDQRGTPHIVPHIVDLQMAGDVGFDDNFLYSRMMPTKLNESSKHAIIQTAIEGIKALGMRSSPAHIEIILTPRGPRIVEIGARTGGYRERMYSLSSGINLVDAAVAVALGQQPILQTTRNEPSAVIELFPKHTGSFIDIERAEYIEQLASCVSFKVTAKPGSIIGIAADGYKFAAVVVLHNTNMKQFDADFSFINHHIRVRVDQTK